MRTFNQCLDEEPATEDMKVGHFFAQVMRRYDRALAEQEKADVKLATATASSATARGVFWSVCHTHQIRR